MYCVPIKAPDRGRLTEDEICCQLMHILDDAPCLASPPPVGILTASHRHHWAEAREALCFGTPLKSPLFRCLMNINFPDERNRRNLDLIQKAMLVVCLDEPLPATYNSKLHKGSKGHQAGQRDETNMMLQMLHGGGSNCNSANRWFDKTVQLVISNDGVCGLCYEHSPAEGVAVILLMEKLLKHCDELSQESVVPSPSGHLPPPERLEWALEAVNHQHIETAAKTIDRYYKRFPFFSFGRAIHGLSYFVFSKLT